VEEKSQFDWANQGILKIGDLYVRGTYDGYGRVEIPVEGGNKKESKVIGYPKEHLEFADANRDALLATEIFCGGDGKKDGK